MGKPWLTQYWTREIVERVYGDLDPQHGYNGDEDQGLMGSLAVLMKIGLFEMRGGAGENPEVQIGSPLFDQVKIHLNPKYYEGKTFVIKTQHNSDENRYIKSMTLNKKDLNKVWLNHSDIVKGGELHLQMTNRPNKNLGIDSTTFPSSVSLQN